LCDNTSAISVAKNLVLHKWMRHLKRRHHFLRDHVEKGDIKMRYIDTERQLADIFTKPLMLLALLLCGGGVIGVCHPYGLVWGRVDALFCILVSFAFLLHFHHTHLSHFASPIILACIYLIMPIIVLEWVVMRYGPFCYTMLDNLSWLQCWAHVKTWQLNSLLLFTTCINAFISFETCLATYGISHDLGNFTLRSEILYQMFSSWWDFGEVCASCAVKAHSFILSFKLD
jgi:hypothetical protein